ncbi:MAG: cytochrome c biogenesis protein, partial [Methanosarcinales archaeon]
EVIIMNQNFKKIFFAITVIVMLIAIYMVFFYAPVPVKLERPPDATDPIIWENYRNSFKIFYFHIPIAISAYVALTIVFLSSIGYLRRGEPKWDLLAKSSAEVGVIFAGLTLISGSIWAKSAWNVYWVWDLRLTTSLVLFLIYLAYLALRQAITDAPEKQARLSAVFGIVGFICVPLSFLSIRLWRTQHPLVLGPGGGGISGSEVISTLLINFVAYLLMCAFLITLRMDNEKLILSSSYDG